MEAGDDDDGRCRTSVIMEMNDHHDDRWSGSRQKGKRTCDGNDERTHAVVDLDLDICESETLFAKRFRFQLSRGHHSVRTLIGRLGTLTAALAEA